MTSSAPPPPLDYPPLIITLGDRLFSVAAARVIEVDFIDVITPLPFMAPPIQGLTCFRETPVLQIDTPLGLAVPDPDTCIRRKRLILRDETGALLALSVDAVKQGGASSKITDWPALPWQDLWRSGCSFAFTPRLQPPEPPTIQIDCAGTFYCLPSSRVMRIEGRPDTTRLSESRSRPDSPSTTTPLVPLIDTGAFLFGRPTPCITQTVLLEWPSGQSIWLGVEALHFYPDCNTGDGAAATGYWIALDWPEPLATLFDAGMLDQSTRQWTLKLKSTLVWSDWSWRLKKALLKAVVGWVTDPGPGHPSTRK